MTVMSSTPAGSSTHFVAVVGREVLVAGLLGVDPSPQLAMEVDDDASLREAWN